MKDIVNIDKNKTVLVEVDYSGQHYVEYIETLKLSEEYTPAEVRSALNLVSSRFAYWSSMYTDITTDLKKKQAAFDRWIGVHMREVLKEYGRQLTSDTGRRQQIMVDYPDEYKKKWQPIVHLEHAQGKVKAILGGIEMESRVLQTINSSLRSEMEMMT